MGRPPGEDTSSQPASLGGFPRRGEGFLASVAGVIGEPVVTMRRLTRRGRVRWALAVSVALAVAWSVVTVASLRGPTYADMEGLERAAWIYVLVFAAVLGPFVGVVLLVLIAALYHVVAQALRGNGRYEGILVGLAFASIPGFLGVPIYILSVPLGFRGPALSWALGLGLTTWVAVLAVIAVRENYGFTTERAILAFLLPALVGMLLVMALFSLLLVVSLTVVAA